MGYIFRLLLSHLQTLKEYPNIATVGFKGCMIKAN